MLFQILLIFFCLSAPSAFANPYEMSGNVFDIVAIPIDTSEVQAEKSYQKLIEVYKDEPIALKILEYAKTRVWLIKGWVFIGSTQILPFEGFTKAAYQPDSDILHIYRHILDEEHKHSYLHEAVITRPENSARYLAALNLPELAVAGQNPLFNSAGDLAYFNRQLANDLYISVTRMNEYKAVSSGDLLFRILRDALLVNRYKGVPDGDRGPLAGLLLNVAGRLPTEEKKKFFEQVETLIEWRLPLITLANSAPFVPYFNPEREAIFQQIRIWLNQRWPKPPASRLHSFCSKFLGNGDD